MKITRNEFSGNRAVIEVEFQIERGWFQQYPEYSIVIGTGSPQRRIGENFYSRPNLAFFDLGPSLQTVTANVDFEATKDQPVIVMIYTRANPSSGWVMRYNRAVKVGFGAIVEQKAEDWTTYVKPVAIGVGVILTIFGSAKLIQAVKA